LNVLIPRMSVPEHDYLAGNAAFLILSTKRNVWLTLAWFCVLFVYQFVIDMNVSGSRCVPAVVVLRLCVDCDKLNELQAHFPRKFGAFAIQLYALYVFLDVGFVLALVLQLALQCDYLGL